MVDMGISFLLALSTFYVCSVRRVERRSLRIGVLLAWNSKIFFNFLQVSAVFDPDNKCKLGDRVVWTAVTFRLCEFQKLPLPVIPP
ncbi:hypothetical protein DFJ73DRAFT_834312 [Zopfochytrium polystomum]|nr:hypothetical protein DFJ73DRAFT_834312 [Zopfochytrium polystomum]